MTAILRTAFVICPMAALCSQVHVSGSDINSRYGSQYISLSLHQVRWPRHMCLRHSLLLEPSAHFALSATKWQSVYPSHRAQGGSLSLGISAIFHSKTRRRLITNGQRNMVCNDILLLYGHTRTGSTGDLVYANVLGRHLLFVNSSQIANDLFEKRSSNYSDRNALPMINDL